MKKHAFFLLFLLVLFLAVPIVVFAPVWDKSIQLPKTEIPSSSPEEAALPSPTSVPEITVPDTQVLKKVDTVFHSVKHATSSGYTVEYPSAWHVEKDDDKVESVSSSNAKWNVNFTPESEKFNDLKTAFLANYTPDPSATITKVEQFSQPKGFTIYFLTVKGTDGDLNGVWNVVAIFVDQEGNYFKWQGYAGSAKNEKILKQIAVSIQKQ